MGIGLRVRLGSTVKLRRRQKKLHLPMTPWQNDYASGCNPLTKTSVVHCFQKGDPSVPNLLEIYMAIQEYIEGRISAGELAIRIAPADRYIFEQPTSELARVLTLVQAAMADRDDGQSDGVTRAFLQRCLVPERISR